MAAATVAVAARRRPLTTAKGAKAAHQAAAGAARLARGASSST
jgi:hypothetical protein